MWRRMLKDWSWIGVFGLIVMAGYFMILGVYSNYRNGLGMPFIAMGCVGLVGLFLALRRRKKLYGDGPTTDERERWIRARGESAGCIAVLGLWFLTSLIVCHVARARGITTISLKVDWISSGTIYSFLIWFVVSRITMRLIRRKEMRNGQG
jgi:hypothetical protein